MFQNFEPLFQQLAQVLVAMVTIAEAFCCLCLLHQFGLAETGQLRRTGRASITCRGFEMTAKMTLHTTDNPRLMAASEELLQRRTAVKTRKQAAGLEGQFKNPLARRKKDSLRYAERLRHQPCRAYCSNRKTKVEQGHDVTHGVEKA